MVKHALLSFTFLYSCNILAVSEHLSVKGYLDTEFDAMFEIKVSEYPKVILDCQSFFHQLVVYQEIDGTLQEKDFYSLDFGECYQAHEFLYEAKVSNQPVCLSIDRDDMTINLSNDSFFCK